MPNVSIGYGVYQKGYCRVDEAIKNADEQLYEFKKNNVENQNIFC